MLHEGAVINDEPKHRQAGIETVAPGPTSAARSTYTAAS
jgi:hypothetical protein